MGAKARAQARCRRRRGTCMGAKAWAQARPHAQSQPLLHPLPHSAHAHGRGHGRVHGRRLSCSLLPVAHPYRRVLRAGDAEVRDTGHTAATTPSRVLSSHECVAHAATTPCCHDPMLPSPQHQQPVSSDQ
eukprot:356975-Chlamydomonas_euryale.AAC.1